MHENLKNDEKYKKKKFHSAKIAKKTRNTKNDEKYKKTTINNLLHFI